ncbi:MAG: molybdenum cofactor guanylyltransferase [Cryomorphaceae bacterium]|nr:MAG: molybdenum cofactor guanylyltransferase [Cryomorphaceae bacterium]
MKTQHTTQFSAAILAGGKSTRFGKDKGLALLHNKPLVQYVAEVARAVSNDVLIVSQNKAYQPFAERWVQDEYKDCGPLGGLHAALTHAKNPYCFLLACDMPYLSLALLEEIKKHIHSQAMIPVMNGHMQPLCACYHRDALPVVTARLERGFFKMSDTIALLNHQLLGVDENSDLYSPEMFMNVNTLAEWQQLRKP